MGIVVMWLLLTASSRPLSGLRCTEVVLWASTVSKILVVSQFGDAVTIIAGAYRTVRMRVSSDTDARIVRHASPEVVSSCVEVPSSIAEVPSSVVKMVSRVGETDGRSKNGDIMCERRNCVVASTVERERADICIRLSPKEKHVSIIEENQQILVSC